MTTEVLAPNAVVASANINGATTGNLAAQDGSWATASANNVASQVRVGFPTPTGPLNSGAGLQTITVQARRNSTNNTTPSYVIEIYEAGGGTPLASSSSIPVTAVPSSSQVNSFTFDAALLAAQSGADLEARVITSPLGGSGSNRNSVDYGYIAWTADYTAAVHGNASGGIGTVTASAPAGSANGGANASGLAGTGTASAPTGAASGDASGASAPGTVTAAAPEGSASAGSPGNASGPIGTVTASAPTGAASGDGSGSAGLAEVIAASPEGVGSGDGQAAGNVPAASAEAPSGSGSGDGSASAGVATVVASAPTGTASAGSSVDGSGAGGIGTVSSSPPQGSASGDGSGVAGVAEAVATAPEGTGGGGGSGEGSLNVVQLFAPEGSGAGGSEPVPPPPERIALVCAEARTAIAGSDRRVGASPGGDRVVPVNDDMRIFPVSEERRAA